MRFVLTAVALLSISCGGPAPVTGCSPSTCSGCCTSDSRCVVEVRERDTYCGFNGSACLDCAAMGKTCSTATLACQ